MSRSKALFVTALVMTLMSAVSSSRGTMPAPACRPSIWAMSMGPPTESAATDPVIIFFTPVRVMSIMFQVWRRPREADSRKPLGS